jgi:hypothetical protein
VTRNSEDMMPRRRVSERVAPIVMNEKASHSTRFVWVAARNAARHCKSYKPAAALHYIPAKAADAGSITERSGAAGPSATPGLLKPIQRNPKINLLGIRVEAGSDRD